MRHSQICRHVTLLFTLSVAVALSTSPLYAAADEYVVRSNVSEVRLSFAASDRQGHSIRTLRASDVAVADNGNIIRNFRSFRAASESPLDLVILLDASDSVATQIPAEIAEAENFVATTNWGERDRVSIITFGGTQAQLLCARNCRTASAQQKLSSLSASGATPLYDALFEAAELLKRDHDPESRSAMILFSDGLDTISIHAATDVTEAAQNLQSAIYTVNSSARNSGGQGDTVLNFLAEMTGGLSFSPGKNLPEALRLVLDDLHSGYVLTYRTPEIGGQHSVRILPTADPSLRLRSRQAYDATE